MRECLVIIDVQKGFITEETRHILDKIKALIESRNFASVVATRFINTPDSPHYIFTNWDKMMDGESQKLDPFVERVSERVFDKNINTCFTEEFINYIESEDIQKLIFLGIDTDCCVLKTAFDSFDRKIRFEVLTEYCASTGGEEFHRAACLIMKRSLGDTSVH